MNLCKANNGLILVTGKTGSGKSTTLAAMIDDINTREKGSHPHHRGSDRIRAHAQELPHQPARDRRAPPPSPRRCMSALREDPDVILVGELRDLETMSIAVTAAEMGILVMGTLHTNGARRRSIAWSTPSRGQAAARAHHAVHQPARRGVAAAHSHRRQATAASPPWKSSSTRTPPSNLIRQGKIDQLENAMQAAPPPACAPWTRRSNSCWTAQITGKEAFKKAINKSRFEQFEAVKDAG
jgi:twitching motility protein PilT